MGPDSDRFDAQRREAVCSFGDGYLRARIDPGRAVRCEMDSRLATLRASGPFPAFRLDNGRAFEQRVTVELRNTDVDAVFRVLRTRLSSGVSREPTCARAEADLAPDVRLAPLEPEAEVAGGGLFSILLPACGAIEVQATLSPLAGEDFRLAVVGPISSDARFLERLVADLGEWRAGHVVFLGDVWSSAGIDPFSEFSEGVAGLAIPFSVTPSSGDIAAGAAGFRERFGQTDYLAHIGAVPLLSIDTGDGVLVEGQMSLVSDVATGGQRGLVVTHVAPIPDGGGAEDGLRSVEQAMRLQGMLLDRGFVWLFAAGDDGYLRRPFGEATWFETAGGRGDTDHYLRVTLQRPLPRYAACDDEAGCSGGQTCVSGYCRTPCSDDDACPEGSPDCDGENGICGVACDTDGDCPPPVAACGISTHFCEELPKIRVERRDL